MNRFHLCARRAFSLVISLIILTLLSVLVVGFLSSTQLDRTTAHAFLGKSQAELAADTAVNQAITLLREHITEYPDSATYWETLNAPTKDTKTSLPVEGTMLYFNDQPLPTGYDSSTKTPATPVRYLLPLFSRGADSQTGKLLGPAKVTDKSSILDGEAWTESPTKAGTGLFVDATAVDLNQPRFNGDSVGWIGSPPQDPNTPPRPFRARWIELKENGDPAGKTVGRYAFWMEDESFKVNLNTLGATAGGRGSEASENDRLVTTAATALPLPPQVAALLPLQGLLQSVRAPASVDPDTCAKSVFDRRSEFLGGQFPDFRSFNQIDLGTSKTPYRLSDETKFLATTHSGSSNLSRHGSQRLNLGGMQLETAGLSQTRMTQQVRQIVAALRYHTPNFGQRFYRLQYPITEPTSLDDSKTVQELARRNATQVRKDYPSGLGNAATSHADTYLYKIAANIRDYIDTDYQPTIVVLDPGSNTLKHFEGMVMAAGDADQFDLFNRQGPNHCWALGKDSVPLIQEVLVRFRSEATGGDNYRLRVDYYVEFWNMTDRDIRVDPDPKIAGDIGGLGADPFIRISNPVRWFGHRKANNSAGTRYGDPVNGMPLPNEPMDLVLQLKGTGIIFPAGACTVITSAPLDPNVTAQADKLDEFAAFAPFTGNLGGGTATTSGPIRKSGLWRVPVTKQTGAREFSGTMPSPSANYDGFWFMPRDPNATNTPNQEDYETEVTLGNTAGILDGAGFAVSIAQGGVITYKPSGSSTQKIARDDTYGGSLRGNAGTSLTSNPPTPSQLGDPRSNDEQLIFLRYQQGGDPDQTRYFNQVGNIRFTLGWPNSRYVVPHLNITTGPPYGYPWPDYYKVWPWTSTSVSPEVTNPNADTAPAVVRNSRLTSIGQLGDIFDPARILNTTTGATLGIEYSRGGGRTLKIGQPDDLVDMLSSAEKAPSRAWAAWRLTDFFATNGDAFLPGQININGLRRDNGAALRAACLGMRLKPVGCSASTTTPSGPYDKSLLTDEGAATGVQALIDQAIDRMKTNDPIVPGKFNAAAAYYGPFSERGELSELAVFNDPTEKLMNGTKTRETFDRGREELFRRLADQITTRGSVFSVYAIGQSITEGPAPMRQKRVIGTHAVKVTFALVPKKKDNTDFGVALENFNPIDTDPDHSTSVQTRFAKPDHYDVQILQASLR